MLPARHRLCNPPGFKLLDTLAFYIAGQHIRLFFVSYVEICTVVVYRDAVG